MPHPDPREVNVMAKVIYNGEKDRNFKDVLGEHIPALAAQDDKVVYLDADLANCIGMGKFIKEHPDRGFDCGIAEANMVGIAAGLSSGGFKPIMHTFGPFASRRCFDQVYLSVGYAKNSVTILGTDAGVCAAMNGGTHMPLEDVALYRAIPGARVFDMTDTVMLKDVLAQCKDLDGVKYIRLGRKQNFKMYEEGSTFELGKGIPVLEDDNADAVIFATGIMVAKAIDAAKALAGEGIKVSIYDMFTVKPLDEDLVIRMAEKTGAVVTAENHNRVGGLYSAVSDVLAQKCPVPIEHVAVEDRFGEVGPQDYLEEEFGLTTDHIVQCVKAAVARKK